jgi:hypothetical protein
MTSEKSKQTSIATVRCHLRTLASFPDPLHFSLVTTLSTRLTTVLEFYNNLWGLEIEYEIGLSYRSAISWHNRFLEISTSTFSWSGLMQPGKGGQRYSKMYRLKARAQA